LNGVLLQKNVSEKASHVGKCFNQFVSLHSLHASTNFLMPQLSEK